jgi:hypothetical protein
MEWLKTKPWVASGTVGLTPAQDSVVNGMGITSFKMA